MPFIYSNYVHVRKHGPSGYDDYTTYKPWLRDDFQFRCVYCLERERWYPSGDAAFGVDHLRPQGNPANADLVCNYENLVYACNRCNSVKRDVVLLNPCESVLAEHIRVDSDGTVIGISSEGSDLVNLFGLNKAGPTSVRQHYMRVILLYQSQPDDPDVETIYRHCFGYPEDLPDLARLRPKANSRPGGLNETFYRQRVDGRLPAVYF